MMSFMVSKYHIFNNLHLDYPIRIRDNDLIHA